MELKFVKWFQGFKFAKFARSKLFGSEQEIKVQRRKSILDLDENAMKVAQRRVRKSLLYNPMTLEQQYFSRAPSETSEKDVDIVSLDSYQKKHLRALQGHRTSRIEMNMFN